MQHVQTQKYDRVSLLSLAILVVLTWGFYRTYIQFFPAFDGFQPVHHFHGVILLLWIALLIVQPWLMSRKKHQLHKMVGKISFVLAPLVMLSIFLVSRVTYYGNLQTLPTSADAVAIISLSIPAAVVFGILYALAVANRRRTYYHMRYMVGTGILMIGPGLGRILTANFGLPINLGVTITLVAVAFVALLFLVLDIVKKQNYVPNLIVTGLLILQSLLWELRYTAFWQKTGEIFADVFF